MCDLAIKEINGYQWLFSVQIQKIKKVKSCLILSFSVTSNYQKEISTGSARTVTPPDSLVHILVIPSTFPRSQHSPSSLLCSLLSRRTFIVTLHCVSYPFLIRTYVYALAFRFLPYRITFLFLPRDLSFAHPFLPRVFISGFTARPYISVEVVSFLNANFHGCDAFLLPTVFFFFQYCNVIFIVSISPVLHKEM